MTPIHELLNRIRWDEEFGRGELILMILKGEPGCVRISPETRVPTARLHTKVPL
jgi:hypothetical protein